MNNELKKEIQFEEIVMLLDATYLDGVVAAVAGSLSQHLGRSLTRADLSILLECLALDGGVRPPEASQEEASKDGKPRRIQVLFIYDRTSPKLQALHPGDLKQALNDQAFQSPLGEFVLNSYPTTEFAGRTDFYVEALKLVVDSADAKQILTVADENACGEEVQKVLDDAVKAGKSARMFGLRPRETPMFESLVFALARALGVKSGEI